MSTVYWNTFRNYPNDQDRQRVFDSMIEPALNTCDWIKSLPILAEQFLAHHGDKGLSPSELHETSDRIQWNLDLATTAKTCPAILQVLKNSYVLKAPADVSYSPYTLSQSPPSDQTLGLTLTSHAEPQYKTSTDVLMNKMSVKVGVPIVVSVSDPDVHVMYLPATYHNHAEQLEVSSGVLSRPHTNRFELNVQSMVDSNDKYINIKAGEALCYLYFSKRTKFVYDGTLEHSFVRERHLTSRTQHEFRPNKWYKKLFNRG